MCALPYRIGDPYKIQGKRIVFTNWYFVQQGSFGWYDSEGRNVTVRGDQNPFEATFKSYNYPWGIKIRVNEASKFGPVIKTEEEWEAGGPGLGTIIKEDGIYKLWGVTGWGSSLPSKGINYLAYYESNDGYNWKRPNLGMVEFNGSRNNNLIPGPKFAGTVFIDPTSDDERYKMVSEAVYTLEEYRDYLENAPGCRAVEPAAIRDNRVFGMQGAVSPDGIQWETLPYPLVIALSDTQVVGYYDTFLKKYVIYSRDWVAGPQAGEYSNDEYYGRWGLVGRRAINRVETDDFRSLPLPELIIEPDPSMQPYEVLYTNCRTTIPGAPDHHVMFPTVWVMTGGDYTYVIMYSSHNGKLWNRISNGPVLRTGIFGSWDGGCIFASPNLIELPGGDFALPYTGWSVPHKYPRVNATRSIGYAIWPKGRLSSLAADEYGEFTTTAIVVPGERLFINAVTERTGYIAIEACDISGTPINGREFENSIPIFGDCYRQLVTWKGHDNLGIRKGEAVILRFKMHKASIYSLDFES
ncbi:MAG: hypothetical protein GX754_01505 [Clostridiaceae bacterium]|nr:hypothetical protein [Clostridiaceae bacterium]